MRLYECIKELVLPSYDENGYLLEGNEFVVKKGTGWREDENSDYNLIGNMEAIRLVEITYRNYGNWIEINEDTLEEHFIKLD